MASEPPPPVVLNFDTVMVAPVQPSSTDDPALVAAAVALTARLTAAIEARNAFVPLSDVPDFDDRGYDATTYAHACPPGQYAGCALVLGQRGSAQWVAGGIVLRDGDGFVFEGTFVDVENAREVLAYEMPVDLGGDVFNQVADAFDRILRGDYALSDLRDIEDPAIRAEREAARDSAIRSSLADLANLGAVERPTAGDLSVTRLRSSDVAAMDRAGAQPWATVDLSRSVWRRWRNSGLPLDSWQRRADGRKGRIAVVASAAPGVGPWHERFDGEVLRDDSTLAALHVVEIQEVIAAPAVGWSVGAGYGLTPWLELGLRLDGFAGRIDVTLDEDVEGTPDLPGSTTSAAMSSTAVGGTAVIVPLVSHAVHPRVVLRGAHWTGRALDPGVADLVRLEAPTAWLAGTALGIEGRAADDVSVFAQFRSDLTLGPHRVRTYDVGQGLGTSPTPSDTSPWAFAAELGVAVHLGPL